GISMPRAFGLIDCPILYGKGQDTTAEPLRVCVFRIMIINILRCFVLDCHEPDTASFCQVFAVSPFLSFGASTNHGVRFVYPLVRPGNLKFWSFSFSKHR